MFGRRTRAERKLQREAVKASPFSGAALVGAYEGARPVVERLLYDDDLRDNIRTFIESAGNILDELSGESPAEIVAKLWDDNKLRKEVEAAVQAAQEGARRVQGQRVGRRGGGRLLLVLGLAGGVGFLFLNPRTGPEARRIAGEVVGALRS
ncbi:MAG TPA: hypothetical protein VK361_11340 [Rubrobacteraceae bacterium]|nr:hypothetical protein [Rubrobacteraceae bacterium]